MASTTVQPKKAHLKTGHHQAGTHSKSPTEPTRTMPVPEISINFLYQLIGELYIQNRAKDEYVQSFDKELRELRALVESKPEPESP